MDDTLKTVIFGLLGMVVFHASLEKRAGRDARREVEEAFHHSGSVSTRVEARGVFGMFANRVYSIDVYGSGLQADQLPFVAVRRSGWKGQIRHLRLHFANLTLKGLSVDRFEADLPDVSYDLGRALYRDRLVIRGADAGPASVRIGAVGLRTFVAKKYSQVLSDIQVGFHEKKVTITGKLFLFGSMSPFTATGELKTRGDRYIDITSPVVEMNGQLLGPAVAANIVKQINPVLDISADLGLGGYFTLSSVTINDEAITIFGRAAIPQRDAGVP